MRKSKINKTLTKKRLSSFLLPIIVLFAGLFYSCGKEEPTRVLEYKTQGFIKCTVKGESLSGESLNEYFIVNQFDDVRASSSFEVYNLDTVVCLLMRYDFNKGHYAGLNISLSSSLGTAEVLDAGYSYSKVDFENKTVLSVEPFVYEGSNFSYYTSNKINSLEFDGKRLTGEAVISQMYSDGTFSISLYTVKMEFDVEVYQLIY